MVVSVGFLGQSPLSRAQRPGLLAPSSLLRNSLTKLASPLILRQPGGGQPSSAFGHLEETEKSDCRVPRYFSHLFFGLSFRISRIVASELRYPVQR